MIHLTLGLVWFSGFGDCGEPKFRFFLGGKSDPPKDPKNNFFLLGCVLPFSVFCLL